MCKTLSLSVVKIQRSVHRHDRGPLPASSSHRMNATTPRPTEYRPSDILSDRDGTRAYFFRRATICGNCVSEARDDAMSLAIARAIRLARVRDKSLSPSLLNRRPAPITPPRIWSNPSHLPPQFFLARSLRSSSTFQMTTFSRKLIYLQDALTANIKWDGGTSESGGG